MGPRACYEEGKRFGETLCKAYHDEYGLDTRLGRIFNSYVPRLRAEGFYGRVVSRFILQALRGRDITVYGDGSQTRSFCYITDTLTGLLALAGGTGWNGGVFNIGRTEETTILEVAKKLLQLLEGKSRVVFLSFPAGEHRRRSPDIAKAVRDLGWKPLVGLEVGLGRTVDWFRSLSLV